MKSIKILTSVFLLSSSLIFAADDVPEPSSENDLFNEDLTAFEQNYYDFPTISSESLEVTPNITLPARKKSTFIAVGLSALIPGLGHTYLGDLKTAGSLFGSSGAAHTLNILSDSNEPLRISSFVAAQNLSFYGIYAAYRDTHLYNNDIKNIPIDSFADLSTAPFNFKILKKPEVWGGFIGAISLAAIISKVAYKSASHVRCDISSNEIMPLAALPIGIGEEAFFRGFIQSSFYDALPPWGAITASSLIFGLTHIPNAVLLDEKDRWRYYSFSLPFITTLGAYFGFLAYKNNSLKESVALHTWYDFTLFLIDALVVQSSIKWKKEFSFSFDF